MNPHTPHPDDDRTSADRPRTDPTDPDLPDTGLPGPSRPSAGSPEATQPVGPRLAVKRRRSRPCSTRPATRTGPTPRRTMAGPLPGRTSARHARSARTARTRQPRPQNFFDWVRRQGIYRGRDRWIGGVASGIAHRLQRRPPDRPRHLLIVLTIFAGSGSSPTASPGPCCPNPTAGIHVQEAAGGRWTAGMTGALIATVLGLPSLGTGVWGWDRFGLGAFIWTVFWVGGAIALCLLPDPTQQGPERSRSHVTALRFSNPAGTVPFAGTGPRRRSGVHRAALPLGGPPGLGLAVRCNCARRRSPRRSR